MSLILVTNDDGVHSPGLIALFRAMKGLSDACIVAPDRERSAASHSLTLHRPLKVEKLRDGVYSINGTPTDCVAVGASKILKEKPSLIVSGINRGGNLGDDITYSGTVSAAMEGTILGIPSFAVSLVTEDRGHPHFDTAVSFAVKVAKYILDKSLPYDTLLNVNVPDIPLENIKGLKFTRQGKRIYNDAIKETFSPWEEKFYWIGGGKSYWEHGEDTDTGAVKEGYVSITPLHMDFTNHEALKLLKKQWEEG
jgi:5'-nucleotidase